jgi:hypothetical protein
MLNEFVEKILVHEAEGERKGYGRLQKVEIYLNFISNFDVPGYEETTPEPFDPVERQRAYWREYYFSASASTDEKKKKRLIKLRAKSEYNDAVGQKQTVKYKFHLNILETAALTRKKRIFPGYQSSVMRDLKFCRGDGH